MARATDFGSGYAFTGLGVYSLGFSSWESTGLRLPTLDLATHSLDWESTIWESSAGSLWGPGYRFWIWQTVHWTGSLESTVFESTAWEYIVPDSQAGAGAGAGVGAEAALGT